MILLELDPNIVKPGWTPLLITIGIALVLVLLYRSMRAQFRRVDDNFGETSPPTTASPPETSATATDPGTADQDETADTSTSASTGDEQSRRV